MRLKLLILFFIGSVVAMANETAIKVILSDGSSQLFMLDECPVAKFVNESLVITSKDKEVTINLNDGTIVQVIYINDETGISEVRSNQSPIFHITDYGLEVNNIKPNSILYLYDMHGAAIAKVEADQEGHVKIPLKGTGVYIVKTSVSSIKIRK